MNKKFGPAIFLYWLRHLTNWNAILSALWFILIGAFARQLDAKPLIVLGIITVLLNSFVFFVRWGWFKI